MLNGIIIPLMEKGHTYDYHIEKVWKRFKYEDFILCGKKNGIPESGQSCSKSRAQLCVMTTKHHDGFCLLSQ